MTALREAVRPPFFVGALAIVVFVVWASKDAGFAVTTWYPGALFLLVLLAVVLAAYQPARSGLSGLTLVAIALFGAFALWCAASIAFVAACRSVCHHEASARRFPETTTAFRDRRSLMAAVITGALNRD